MSPKVDGSPTPLPQSAKLPKFGAINRKPQQNLVPLCYRGVILPDKLQLLLQIQPRPNQMTIAGSMQHEINGVGGTLYLRLTGG